MGRDTDLWSGSAYSFHRVAPFLWRWRTHGAAGETGLAFSRTGARWAARSVLRERRAVSPAAPVLAAESPVKVEPPAPAPVRREKVKLSA